jgi:hypothetical protein
MAVNPGSKPLTQRKLFWATLERLVGAGRSASGADVLTRRSSVTWSDPVMIATLAIDYVGPATVRAVANGVEVCVTALDEATGAVFRAALADITRRRSTDRLVHIIVD